MRVVIKKTNCSAVIEKMLLNILKLNSKNVVITITTSDKTKEYYFKSNQLDKHVLEILYKFLEKFT